MVITVAKIVLLKLHLKIGKNKMKLTLDEILKRVVTAINITTGDDGSRSKETMDVLFKLLKMSKKQYKQQVKYYG